MKWWVTRPAASLPPRDAEPPARSGDVTANNELLLQVPTALNPRT